MKTVHAAENRLNYVIDFLKEKSNDDSRLYKKSRERYEHMLSQCKEAVCLLSSILEEDALLEDEIELGASPTNNEVKTMAADLRKELERFENFTGCVSTEYDNDSFEQENITSDEGDSEKEVSFKDKRNVMIEYSNVLKIVSDESNNVYEKDCANLIYDWFKVRFDRQLCPAFRYDIKNIPRWISNIVVAYGSSIDKGNNVEFISNFRKWLNQLKSKEALHNYVVPYDVYQIDRYMAREYTSLEAPILWDMLLDDGLCKLENSKIPIDPSSVYDKVMSAVSEDEHSVLDRYNYYKDIPDVLNYCKLNSEV